MAEPSYSLEARNTLALERIATALERVSDCMTMQSNAHCAKCGQNGLIHTHETNFGLMAEWKCSCCDHEWPIDEAHYKDELWP
jgi:hypothetical protein